MEGRWKYWMGKKVFLILKNKRTYSGEIIEVDDSDKPLIWISILDKFNKKITFVHSEIEVVQEEGE